jgi:predicted DNA-binding WGR domain protein
MSDYHVSKFAIGKEGAINNRKFDNKEDAEHYAKNQSTSDTAHRYEVQKNNEGDFDTIKSYLKGEEV